MTTISIQNIDFQLWAHILSSCAALIAGNCIASIVSFYARHLLRQKMRVLELSVQLALMVLMTFIYPLQVFDYVLLSELSPEFNMTLLADHEMTCILAGC